MCFEGYRAHWHSLGLKDDEFAKTTVFLVFFTIEKESPHCSSELNSRSFNVSQKLDLEHFVAEEADSISPVKENVHSERTLARTQTKLIRFPVWKSVSSVLSSVHILRSASLCS